MIRRQDVGRRGITGRNEIGKKHYSLDAHTPGYESVTAGCKYCSCACPHDHQQSVRRKGRGGGEISPMISLRVSVRLGILIERCRVRFRVLHYRCGAEYRSGHFVPTSPTATSVVLERRVLGLIPTPMKLTEWLSCLTGSFCSRD